jgi:hypothetical protein
MRRKRGLAGHPAPIELDTRHAFTIITGRALSLMSGGQQVQRTAAIAC